MLLTVLGESARYLTVTNSVTTGTVTRDASHIDANRGTRRWANVFAYEVLEPAAASYVPSISQRIMGLVDNTNYKTTIALSSDRTQVTGYPTGATRIFNQPGSATGGRSLVVTVHEGYTGAASASATLLNLHNGGAGSPAPSFRVFQAGIVDLWVAGLGPTALAAAMQARYNECQAAGGIYAA